MFSAEPAKIEGLADAGLDWVSLANNHIRDAGRQRDPPDDRKNLAEYGLAHGGAGQEPAPRPTSRRCSRPATSTVAILAYDTIAPSYAADADKAGSARMTTKALTADVKAARKAGADVVVVFPHWGVEYRPTPPRRSGRWATPRSTPAPTWSSATTRTGPGRMEVYKGKPIWYALGNFVFDQTWSEPTMEGLTLELTFRGKELAQARMRPHLILDKAQPNLIDPAGDGKVVHGPGLEGVEGPAALVIGG